MRALLLIALLGAPALSATTIDSDAWITGPVGVNETSPDGRLEVTADAAHAVLFRVSGVDETPFLIVGQDGMVGVGTTPVARLDITGVGDVGDIALQVDAATTAYQAVFGYAGAAQYRHALRSLHEDDASGSGILFYLWTPGAGGAEAIGDLPGLAVVTTSTNASVHVNPVGTPGYELVVSNGETTGAGTVMAADIQAPSSRLIKEGIRPLEMEAGALRHKRFRYKGSSRSRRGLLYEESPAPLRAGGDALSVNARIAHAELALKGLIERLEALGD